MKIKWLNYILILIGVGIFIFFVRSVDFPALFSSLKSTGPEIILVALLLTITTVLIKAYRWKYLVKQITGANISLYFAFLSILAGVSSASIFPGRSEVTKPLLLKKSYDCKLIQTIPAMFIERIFDFIGVITLFFLALIFISGTFAYTKYFLPFAMAILIIFFLLFFHTKLVSVLFASLLKWLPFSPKLKDQLKQFNYRFFESFLVLRKKRLSLVMFALSMLVMVIEVSQLLYLLYSLGTSVTISAASLGLAGGILMGVIAIIPGGIGVTEFSSAEIIAALSGFASAQVKPAIFLDRIIAYYFIVFIGGLILLFSKKLIKNKEIKS